jgi:hypothetical protein
MSDLYNVEDLYGSYDEGQSGVSINALQAIIANLIVDSANIRDLAVKNQHVESIEVNKIVSVGGAVSNVNILPGKVRTHGGFAEDAVHVLSKITDGIKVKGAANYGQIGSYNGGSEVTYVQYDLGTSHRLAHSKIYFYSMDERHYQYKIKYSLDGTTWYYAAGDANTWAKSVPTSLGGSTMNPTSNVFSIPIVARYVRLYMNGNSVNSGNHVDEWELFSFEQTSIEGGELRANTVIANDITFSGILSGATGEFSGNVEINKGGNQYVASLIDSALTMSYNVPAQKPWSSLGYTGLEVRDQATSHYLRYRKGAIELYDTEMNLGSGGSKAYINFISTAVDTGYIDIVPARTINGLYGNLMVSRDEWLRINDGVGHSNGVYFSNSIVRTDGQLQVGTDGAYFKAASNKIYIATTDQEKIRVDIPNGNIGYMRWYRNGLNLSYLGHPTALNDDLYLYSYNGIVQLYGGLKIDGNGSVARWQRNDSDYIYQSSSFVGLYFGGAIKHTFRSDGTKSGGSIEVDGKNLGMSPIDSPQILLEYVKFGVELTPEGTRVAIDPTFLKTVETFDVFPNKGELLSVGVDHFVIAGEGKASCRIIGERVGQVGKFYEDLDLLTAESEQSALSK